MLLGLIRLGVEAVTSIGVGKVIGNVVKATTPQNITRAEKLLVGVGSAVIGMTVGNITGDYVEKKIATAVKVVNKMNEESEKEKDLVSQEV